MNARPVLEIAGLRYSAGDFSLSVDRLSISEREYLCVVGPTGSGKTALLELIAGIRACRSGTILKDGETITRLAPEKRSIGFSYQDSFLFPFLDVEENILFGARLRDRRVPVETVERCRALMDSMGILHLRRRAPRFLSGGERQRVSLARSLLLKPRLLLLDEPMSAVDAPRRESLRTLLKSIHRAEGLAILHVTHDWREVESLATHVGVMRDGRLISYGAMSDVAEPGGEGYAEEALEHRMEPSAHLLR